MGDGQWLTINKFGMTVLGNKMDEVFLAAQYTAAHDNKPKSSMSELQSYTYEQISLGMSETYTRTVTDADIQTFAEVSGDVNPMHLDDEYAKNTQFGQRIAHGMLSAGFISALVGTRLPGPGCIYVSQSLQFRAPVHIGDTVVSRVEVTELNDRRGFVTLKTTCSVGETDVIRGEAVMMVPRKTA